MGPSQSTKLGAWSKQESCIRCNWLEQPTDQTASGHQQAEQQCSCSVPLFSSLFLLLFFYSIRLMLAAKTRTVKKLETKVNCEQCPPFSEPCWAGLVAWFELIGWLAYWLLGWVCMALRTLIRVLNVKVFGAFLLFFHDHGFSAPSKYSRKKRAQVQD